jgi:hypothetical protein
MFCWKSKPHRLLDVDTRASGGTAVAPLFWSLQASCTPQFGAIGEPTVRCARPPCRPKTTLGSVTGHRSSADQGGEQ